MATPARQAAFARGLAAEVAAANLFESQGFSVLARRVKTARGEIDLIVRRNDLLVFVEVKARRTLAGAAESLLMRQRRRIAGAAEIFLADHPEFAGFDMRLDVVLVAPGRPPEHIAGAFEAE